MTKPKQHRRPVKGTDKPVDAAVGDKRSRAFLVSIESNGRDAQGRVQGANGIHWRTA